MFETSIKLLELGYYEVQFALEGLADENVWKRPAPSLLSVGELAGHIAYGEANRLLSKGDGSSQYRISSPLIDSRFNYYPNTIKTSPTDEQLAMTAPQVYAELMRVHQEAMADFKTLNPEPNARIPTCHTGFTYGKYLEYAAFHIAYHTGQMYTVRHLLGEDPPDN